MAEQTGYVEIALAELAYLVAEAGGDPSTLNAPAGFDAYFEKNEVLALGREIQQVRRESADDAADQTLMDRYFATVGTLVANSTVSLVVHTTARPGQSSIYFPLPEGGAEVLISDGQSKVALRSGPLTVTALLERHPVAEESDALVVGRFSVTGNSGYLAVSRGIAAYSDDGNSWHAPEPDRLRDPHELLREFVTD